MPPASIEVENIHQWDQLTRDSSSIAGAAIQGVDLSERADDLARLDVEGAIFLGCTLPEQQVPDLQERGALVFPELPDLPFNPYRSSLYQATELYDSVLAGGLYAESSDAKIYAWSHAQPIDAPLPSTLAMALHDHSMIDALTDVLTELEPRSIVGIMGGHAVQRDSDDYVGAARLAAQLTQAGRVVMTGGGPGAMEAANLGARLAGQPSALVHALQDLADAPSYIGEETHWAATALMIRQAMRASGISIGIPTWHYGHEPPNVFGTVIAKFFSNALREDILLRYCLGGLIYLPGAAGTVQEVFQAATANYYAADSSQVGPMILVGTEYWTDVLPVWPLLTTLARGRGMAERIRLVKDVDEAVELLTL